MNALFSWINHVDGSAVTLTASASSGDLSASNLADPIIGRRWRTTSLSAYVDIDFATDKTVGVVALRFPRDTTFPLSGTVRHQFDADGGTPGTGAAHDSTAVSIGAADGYGYHLYKPAAAVTARYWRFTFAVTGLSYIDVGRAWAGEAWQPTFDVAGGYEDGWLDLSETTRAARSGAEFVDERARQRQYALALEALSSSERDSIREMMRIAGSSKQVLFCLDPDSFARETVIGRLAGSQPIRHRALTSNLYGKAFVIGESL